MVPHHAPLGALQEGWSLQLVETCQSLFKVTEDKAERQKETNVLGRIVGSVLVCVFPHDRSSDETSPPHRIVRGVGLSWLCPYCYG